METFRIEDLTFTYPGRREPALRDVTLSVEQGEFVTLCGKSGCGKSTLLRQLKTSLAPHGERKGHILFEGKDLKELDLRTQTERIGFVLQSPENQIVTDKVWHELAFGLESLGYDTPTIRIRVAEMASFFGIQTWFHKSVAELSGGQKQLLNLAAIMAMQPSALILDEPTSQLDPIAAADFLETIGKINRELGTTILLTEHRLEEALPMSDRAVVMDEGRIIVQGSPQEAGRLLKERGHQMFLAMPTPMRVYAGVDNHLECPVTVRDGRKWMEELSKTKKPSLSTMEKTGQTEFAAGTGNRGLKKDQEAGDRTEKSEEPVIRMSEVWFKYGRDLPDVVKGLSAKIYKGELYAIVGGNGTGKTTSISLMTGLLQPYRGSVRIKGEELSKGASKLYGRVLGILPQNPQSLFVKKTVELDLLEMFSGTGTPKEERLKRVEAVAELCELKELLLSHPYDLSGGEQQRAALAKILLQGPEILVLDEPTKGLDGYFKERLARILEILKEAGVTVVMVSHDIEFCAKHADRCAMFFDGAIVSEDGPRRFFSGKNFYTTAANRMARGLLPGAVLAEDIIAAFEGDVAGPPSTEEGGGPENFGGGDAPGENGREWERDALRLLFSREGEKEKSGLDKTGQKGENRLSLTKRTGKKKLTPTRIAAGLCFFSLFILTAAYLKDRWTDWRDYLIQLLLMAEAAGFLAAFLPGGDLSAPDFAVQQPGGKRKLSRRTVAAAAMILLAIPLTIYVGYYYLEDRKYYFISMLIILETMLPFAMVFEGRKPQARELVVIAVLCAIAVAGRGAFFMLPQFKPVLAVVILAGVCLGGEAGFLTGAATMFVSNMMFSQGPWTPWQMFAAGIIGFLSGVLFRKGLLRKRRSSLCIFGFLSAFFVYGIVMDTASVLMWQAKLTKGALLVSYMQGLPFNLIHGVATAFFLWVIAGAMIEKLERVKRKYGLLEQEP